MYKYIAISFPRSFISLVLYIYLQKTRFCKLLVGDEEGYRKCLERNGRVRTSARPASDDAVAADRALSEVSQGEALFLGKDVL